LADASHDVLHRTLGQPASAAADEQRQAPRPQRAACAREATPPVTWVAYLLSVEQTATQAQLLFTRALKDQELLSPDGTPLRDDDGPILVACSDNGAELTAIDTRQFRR
jgi:hypothetical protein